MPLRGGRIGSIKHTVGRPRVNPPRFWNATKRADASWHRPLRADGGKLGAPSRSRIRRHHMAFIKSRGFHSLLYINILYLNTRHADEYKVIISATNNVHCFEVHQFFFFEIFLSLGNFKTRIIMTL